MIVEERDYHVTTGKLAELVKLYETEGIELQLKYLGRLVGVFTIDVGALSTYTHIWAYDSYDDRIERRARLQADDTWKAFLAKIQPLIHTQQNRILVPTSFSPLAMTGSLDGKVALVTGASQGIGRAIAEGLAEEGARIVIADLNGAEEAARPSPRASGSRPTSPTRGACSASSTRRWSAAGRSTSSSTTQGLYASLEMRSFEQIPLDEWRRVMDVNVASMFLMCRSVVPVMRAHGGGKIVNISSGTPFRGVPFLLHYVTSKGAIVAFTRALAKEVGKDDVLVNCVAPGFTMSAGVEAHPEVVEKLRDVSVVGADDPARPDCRKTSSAPSST